jgi:predicted short-subunit dehydrogenase-like oxidoreductase (DUF2520 family)
MKVVLIGAGNVGFHLGKKLHKVGVEVVQVFSRTKKKAKKLANKIDAKPITQLKEITTQADLYILAVKDDAIMPIAQKLGKTAIKSRLVVHTSGGTNTANMSEYLNHFGSFYPLQTFSIAKKPNWKTIPFCIDANSKKSKQLLLKLAKKITPKTYEINDEQRAILHVAAVFVNNFSNHLFHIGATICEQENLDFAILKPLIQETVDKLNTGTPAEMQTGPALRNDKKTLATHLQYLEKYPDFKKIYKALTASILGSRK